MRSGTIGTIVLLALACCGTIFLFLVAAGGRADQPSDSAVRRTAPTPDPQMEAMVAAALRDGTVHSVDIASGQVRLSYGIWRGLSLEQKRQSLAVWSRYFQSHGATGRVKILSDQNDTCFAVYSQWSGAKIIF